ncbi:MAG: c-type cytochrome biogenesis protein CcmI, partial [Hyphomicrobium sp.]
IFWIAVAALAAAVTIAITRPLLQRADALSDAAAADLAVYKDQLSEVEADLARGMISKDEADAARTEVGRRLLRTAETDKAVETAEGSSAYKSIHAVATLAIPLLSLALYLYFGCPGLPGLPLSERLTATPQNATAGDLIAKVEARLRDVPDDGKGWDVIAPIYASQGRFTEATDAYANAIRLLGENAKRLEGLALADVRAANGLVTEKAKAALSRAMVLEPKRIEPRIWLALGKEQDGDVAAAIADYKALIAEAPADARWRKAVEERLADVETRSSGKAAPDAATATPPAPTGAAGSEAQSSVAALPAEQRAMIDKMVGGLAARLKENGNDLEGWLKLMRALKVLGRDSEAAGALADAKKQFAADGKAMSEIDEHAKSLGLVNP